MRYVTASLVVFAIALVVSLGFQGSHDAKAVGPLTTTDLNSGPSATDLVDTLLGAGITASNITYTGANVAAGTFAGGTGHIDDIASGIVLSSGDIADVVGPNTLDTTTTNNGQPGDADLDVLAGGTTNDAAVLEFDFVPDNNVVSFRYVFGSEEYNEFVNSSFNDVFGFFVNGVNVALIPPVGGTPVAINNLNCGNPFSGVGPNCSSFRNNDPNDPGPATIDIEFDGLSVQLGFQSSVNANVTNNIKLAIADTNDFILDSAVFIEEDSFVAAPLQPPGPPAVGGIGGLLDADGVAVPSASQSSSDTVGYVAALAVVVGVVLVAGGWYARRRWLR